MIKSYITFIVGICISSPVFCQFYQQEGTSKLDSYKIHEFNELKKVNAQHQFETFESLDEEILKNKAIIIKEEISLVKSERITELGVRHAYERYMKVERVTSIHPVHEKLYLYP